MIEKNYQPADIEHRMARIWEESGAFKAGRPERKDAAACASASTLNRGMFVSTGAAITT